MNRSFFSTDKPKENPIDTQQENTESIESTNSAIGVIGLAILEVTFEARATTHLWHLQTTNGHAHDTLGTFYTEVIEIADAMLELFQAAYGTIKVDKELKLTIKNSPHKNGYSLYMEELYSKVLKLYNDMKIKSRPDLKAKTEELLMLISKTGFLLKLD